MIEKNSQKFSGVAVQARISFISPNYMYATFSRGQSHFVFVCSAGNTFSTLRGHKFDWMLLRDEEATHQTTEPEAILHFVRFDDSSYATDPIIGALEANGYHGDTVLVEGVSTGTAKVSVRFSDRVWKVCGMGEWE